MSRRAAALLAPLLLLMPSHASGGDAPPKPGPNSPDEPLAASFSTERGARFLDAVSVDWTRQQKCGTCHTNYAYMMAAARGEGRRLARAGRGPGVLRGAGRRLGPAREEGQAVLGRRGRRHGRGPGLQRRGDDRQAPPADPRRARPDVDRPAGRRRLGLAQERLASLGARRLLRRRAGRAGRRPCPRRLQGHRGRPARASTSSAATSARPRRPTCTTRPCCSGPRPASTA